MEGNSKSQKMGVKLANPCKTSPTDELDEEPSLTSVEASATTLPTPELSQSGSSEEVPLSPSPADTSQSSPLAGEESTPPSDSFTFKTPTAIRNPRSSNSSKSVTFVTAADQSSPKTSKSEVALDREKSVSSSKKSPGVKIASFAKASPVDRLAPPSSPSPNLDLKTSKIYKDSISSVSSKYPSSSNSGGSKLLTTQTMLPTPALNAALRSFFNYASKSEGSPATDASRSDEEDEDDEDVEEEEILVYMQFDSKLDGDLLQPHTPFKIIGVDSDKPVLQLGNQVFEGNWGDTVGTAVFFEENPSASPGDPVFMKNPPLTLNYHSKTQKSLIMSRIFVRPKDNEDAEVSSNSATGPMVPMALVEVAP